MNWAETQWRAWRRLYFVFKMQHNSTFYSIQIIMRTKSLIRGEGNGRGNLRKNEMKSEIEIRPCWTRSAPTEKETIENRLYPQFSHH